MSLNLPGLLVQPRDRQLLAEVARFRVLTGEHIRYLVFPGVSLRLANRRLSLLVAHGLLERHFLPDIEGGSVVRSRRPVYSLSRSGAGLVDAGLWPGVRFVPSAWAVTRHNLIATDLLVAVMAAGRAASLAIEVFPESALRVCLRTARPGGNRFPTAVLPDGAFTIAAPGQDALAFCVEVVRAGTKGGNKSLLAKMTRYVALNRAGFFQEVFGVPRLRAMLIVTTSPTRAENLVRLALALPHGRNLFWATSYERRPDLGMTFAAETVLTRQLIDAAAQRQTLEPIHSSTQPHV